MLLLAIKHAAALPLFMSEFEAQRRKCARYYTTTELLQLECYHSAVE
jgi:hypothetical protein